MAAQTSQMSGGPSAWSRSAPAVGFVMALGLLVALGLGCSGDHLTRAQPVVPDSLYWALDLNHHAVTLSLQAPYDTLTLEATPRNSRGVPLSVSVTPQYSSADLARVQVEAGVLHAIDLTTAGQPVVVVATLTIDNVKHVDTVLVRVVADTLPKLASLSIHPVPPDSAKSGVDLSFGSPLPVRVTDSTGTPIADPLVAVRSSDPETAMYRFDVSFTPTIPWVTGKQMGTVTLVASATIFGVTKADTLPYQIGLPVFGFVSVQRVATAAGDSMIVFDPAETRVGVGTVVLWSSENLVPLVDTIDVTFTEQDLPRIAPVDSTSFYFASSPFAFLFGSVSAWHDFICSSLSDCNGGNVLLTPEGSRAIRVLSVPGTYEYHSTRTGASGRIIVVDE